MFRRVHFWMESIERKQISAHWLNCCSPNTPGFIWHDALGICANTLMLCFRDWADCVDLLYLDRLVKPLLVRVIRPWCVYQCQTTGLDHFYLRSDGLCLQSTLKFMRPFVFDWVILLVIDSRYQGEICRLSLATFAKYDDSTFGFRFCTLWFGLHMLPY